MSPTPLQQIASATAGAYEIIAVLGQSSAGDAVLAHAIEEGGLVVLLLPPAADEIVVLPTLGETVPASAGACTACGVTLPTWSAACPRCGQRLAGESDDRFTDADLEATMAPAYAFLGRLRHQDTGGSLVFGRDRVDGRVVALTHTQNASGEQVLEAVWESAQPAPAAEPMRPAVEQVARPLAVGAPAASAPAASAASEPRRAAVRPTRRPWIPVVVVGVGALVAAGAWLAWRGAAGRATPTLALDSATTAPVAAGGAAPDSVGAATALTVPATDSTAVRTQQQPVVLPTTVVIDGELPTGWSRTVNGRFRSSDRSVPLRFGTSALIRVEAPGYCPDTIRIPLAPGTTPHWAPHLQGVPMVGGCQ